MAARYEEGKYTFLEGAENTQACEEYIDRVVLENIYSNEKPPLLSEAKVVGVCHS